MQISVQQLVAAGIGPTQAKQFQPFLEPAFRRFGIVTRERVAAFLGQCHVESAGFTRLEEGLYYTSAARLDSLFARVTPANVQRFLRNPVGLANFVYADRMGNGPEASGDGWRFRGRGLKQLTGRANYTAAASALGRPYVATPGLVQEPQDAVLTAAWFWAAKGLNALADVGDIDGITRVVNGRGMVQAAERRGRTARALRALA